MGLCFSDGKLSAPPGLWEAAPSKGVVQVSWDLTDESWEGGAWAELVQQCAILWALYHTVVMKRELSQKIESFDLSAHPSPHL